jgi:hypothetical protein
MEGVVKETSHIWGIGQVIQPMQTLSRAGVIQQNCHGWNSESIEEGRNWNLKLE